MLRVLDHVQYNGSVPWQGEQSVPCKFSDSNPASCVCHLVKRNQTQFHYPLSPWMYLQYPWAQLLEGMSGCFRPSLCQSAFFGPACLCSLLKTLMSSFYLLYHWMAFNLSIVILKHSKSKSHFPDISNHIATVPSRNHKPGVTLYFKASLSNLQPYKLYSFFCEVRTSGTVLFQEIHLVTGKETTMSSLFWLFRTLKCVYFLITAYKKLFSNVRAWVTILLPVSNFDLEIKLILGILLSHWFF